MVADGIWGDGFASDAMNEIAAVRDWEELAEGEEVRFFPALCCRGGAPPPRLVDRVLQRAEILERSTRSAAGRDRKIWRFSAREEAKPVWPLVTSEDATWLRSLVISADARRNVDLRLMARFAFLTGLHPAYLWVEIETLPNWGTTAAWLGEFSRRGRALMPPEVAEYLSDALAETAGRVVVRDPSLSDLICGEAMASALLAAAKQRLAGEIALAHWPNTDGVRLSPLFNTVRRRIMGSVLSFSAGRLRRSI
ncbi:MAG TPA: hypothetical protein VKV96_17400 [Roseiarcus sp.]|nr:hypothetical protein [Roseiarcus sp.]